MAFRKLLTALLLAACRPLDEATPTSGDDDDHDDTGIVTASTLVVTESGVQACAGAADREVLGPFARHEGRSAPMLDHWTWAGGVVAADFDGDGRLEVVSPIEERAILFRVEDDGSLTEVTDAFPPALDTSFASGGSAADYDGDGDLDLYLTRVVGDPAPVGGELGRNRLLRNDRAAGGPAWFTDVTDESGVDACGVHHRTGETSCFRSMASSWGDVDLDGDLDLYVGNYGFADESGLQQHEFDPAEPDFLYLNDGDGTFTDASATIPAAVHDGYTYAGGFHDLDADLDLDLYVVNDFGNCWPNRVMWNEGGQLVYRGSPPDDTICPGPVGSDPSFLEQSMTGMGLAAGDLNGDGWLDLAIPEWKRSSLLLSTGLGLWAEPSDKLGFVGVPMGDQQVGWGTDAGDVDNDGDLDLITQFGWLESENLPLWANAEVQLDAVYLNEPDGNGGIRFVDRAPELGMADPGMTRGGVLADLNRDGWLDLVKRDLTGPDLIYTSRCGAESWLVLHLRAPGLNRFAVGARVEILAGEQLWLRHVVAGGTGYASAGPPEVHVGLGDLDRVDVVRITWPDGTLSEVHDLETRQQVTIERR